MSTEEWLTLTLVAVLTIAVAGAAALAAAEVAILRLRRSRIRVAGDSGDATAVGLLRLLEDLPLVLNTVLLAVLFLQVGAATVAGFLAARFFGGPGATAASVLLTGVLFLYGEAIPKTIAVRHPEAVARRAARPLRILVIALRPVVKVLTTLANWQIPGSLSQPTDDSMSEAELRAVLRESAHVGAIEDHDAAMVHRSFEFGDRKVGDVMVPRNQVAAVGADQQVADALSRAIALGHRRLPVYRSDLDSVIGATRLRDLAATARHSPQSAVATVTTRSCAVRRTITSRPSWPGCSGTGSGWRSPSDRKGRPSAWPPWRTWWPSSWARSPTSPRLPPPPGAGGRLRAGPTDACRRRSARAGSVGDGSVASPERARTP